MAFKKKTWKDRLVEFAGRRTLKRISGSADSQMVVDVSRNEGTVSQAGDAFSAANMNDLEQRIADEFSSINNNLKGFTPIVDSTGRITGYKTQAGADTVFPFRNIENNSITFGGVNVTRSVPLRALPRFVIVTCNVGASNVTGIWYDGVFINHAIIKSVSDSELIIISQWSETYTYSYYLIY